MTADEYKKYIKFLEKRKKQADKPEGRFLCYECSRLEGGCTVMHPPHKDCFKKKKAVSEN